MKNNKNNGKLDQSLEQLADRCDKREQDAQFSKSTEEFTAEFFRKVSRAPHVGSSKRIWMKAAVFAIVCGAVVTALSVNGKSYVKYKRVGSSASMADSEALDLLASPASSQFAADTGTDMSARPKMGSGLNAQRNVAGKETQRPEATMLAAKAAPSDNTSGETAREVSASMEHMPIVIPDRRIIHPIVWPNPMPPIRIVRPSDEKLDPVVVESGSASVRVSGNLAETTYEFIVKNPNNRRLEGNFELPLPDKAAVTNVALDINGSMVDSSIVPKERAREVFDIIERQTNVVDPALTELVGGNTYRTRIWPVEANSTRRIRVQFITQLTKIDGSPVLILPMRFENNLKSFKIRVEVDDASSKPKVETSQFANITFNNWQNALLAEQTIQDVALPEDLRLSLATTPNSGKPVVEKNDGKKWLHVVTPYTAKAIDAQKISLAEINLVWDNSGSRLNHDHTTELEQLQSLIGNGSKVHLWFLNSKLDDAGVFTEPEKLFAAIKDIHYDGGTNLAAVEKILAGTMPTIFVSDGIDNFGTGLNRKAEIHNSLIAISVSSTAETSLLDSLVMQAPSGSFLNLAASGVVRNSTAQELFARQQKGNLPSITVNGSVFECETSVADGTLEIVGMLPEDAKTISVGNTDYAIETKDAPEGSLIKTRYGQLLLAALQRSSSTSREQYIELSKEYRLVTPATSMLVLESADQYIQYEIRPPASQPDWVRQYEEAMGKKNKDKKPENKKDIESVMKRYQTEIIDWYEGKVKVTQREAGHRFATMNARAGMAMPAGAMNAGVQMDRVSSRSSIQTAAAEPMMMANVAEEDAMMDMDVADAGGFAAPATMGRTIAQTAKKSTASGSSQQNATKKIQLKQWTSDAEYLKEMQKDEKKALDVYWKFRKDNANNAGFFVDCAQFFCDHGQKELAVHVLSNLAELQLENRFLLRILGYNLRFYGDFVSAERVFRKVLELCPEEAQSYRDLALTLRDEKKWQEAADMFLYIIEHNFDGRFPNIDLIAVTELNRVVVLAKQDGVELKSIDSKLIHPLETDLRVVISWDTDLSDMDLHVTDPTDETCYYGHRYTVNGGRISHDFTRGYGPEEFMVREALNGKYKLKAHYYGQNAASLIGPVTLYAEITKDFGRDNETTETLTFRLNERNDLVKIGEVETTGSKKEAKEPLPPLPPKPIVNEPVVLDAGAALPTADTMYQVRANESLEDIAERFYHDRAKTDRIRNANQNKVRNGRIPAGTLITVPAAN